MPHDTMLCPVCKNEIPHIEDWSQEIYGSGSQIVVPLASAVYECSEHGFWRIYISGAFEKVERRKQR
jgi:hypothetical protein